jgi:hypothetical protein
LAEKIFWQDFSGEWRNEKTVQEGCFIPAGKELGSGLSSREESIMKFGMRTPSPKKSLSARTKGAATRAMKRALIPGYGKKGMGMLRDPERALKNKLYRKTTFSLWDLFK